MALGRTDIVVDEGIAAAAVAERRALVVLLVVLQDRIEVH
jgi:hypothetical protein